MAYSGKFVVRIAAPLHKSLAEAAQRGGTSLNRLCAALLKDGLDGQNRTEQGRAAPWIPSIQSRVDALKERFHEDLIGVTLFGSRIRGDATSSSDLDLLVVLSDHVKIERQHYQWWDTLISSETPFEINPHFVHLPKDEINANGIWFEVALHSEVFWERDRTVSKKLDRFKEVIASNKVQRFWTNGHPYWTRRNHEKH